MKYTNQIILSLTCLLWLTPGTSAEKIDVKVKGFVCALCGQGVEKKLNAVSKQGIENYAVDMDDKIVSFQLKPNQSLSDTEIKAAVTKAGYDVVSITRKQSIEPTDEVKPNVQAKPEQVDQDLKQGQKDPLPLNTKKKPQKKK